MLGTFIAPLCVSQIFKKFLEHLRWTPADLYLVNIRSTKKRKAEICSKLKKDIRIKISENKNDSEYKIFI